MTGHFSTRMTARRVTACLVAVCLALTLVPAAQAPVSAQEMACGDWLVATSHLEPGRPLPDNAITLSRLDGSAEQTIESAEPQSIHSLSYPNRALVRSLDGGYSLLDTEQSVAIELAFPGTEGQVIFAPAMFVSSAGTRFQLFADATGGRAYLVDLDDGSIESLHEVLEGTGPVVFGAVSAGDDFLLIQRGRVPYLASINQQSGALDTVETLDAASAVFSGSGDRVLTVPGGPDEGWMILARDLSNGQELPIAPPGRWFGLRTYSDGLLLATVRTEVVRIFPDGSEPQSLFDVDEPVLVYQYDPGSGRILVRTDGDEVQRWWIVAADGSADPVELTGIEDANVLVQLPESRWAYVPPLLGPELGTPGAPYLSVDLSTGAITTLLVQDSADFYIDVGVPTTDGRYRLLGSVSTPQGRLWLLDHQTGASSLVGSSPGNVIGAISPDGCYLAVGDFDALGEGREGSVTVTDRTTGQELATLQDAWLLGWVPDPL